MKMQIGLLIAALTLAFSAQAVECVENPFEVVPDQKSVQTCQFMGMAGKSSLRVCKGSHMSFVAAGGAEYKVTSTDTEMRHSSSYSDDVTGELTITSIVLNDVTGIFQAHVSERKATGMKPAVTSCTGTFSLQ